MNRQNRCKYSPEFRSEQSRSEIPVGRYSEPETLALLALKEIKVIEEMMAPMVKMD